MSQSRHKPYLAFDFGAQSGRAVLGYLQAGILTTEEVHRFDNEPVQYGGSLHWDLPRLWFEVRKTFSKLGEAELSGIGVDAWGVDYALLGERGELLQNPYHYRDRRTEGIVEEVLSRIDKEEIYKTTGIQFMPINTLYQLVAARKETPQLLAAAKYLLTIPDLFNYWLTGKAVCEFTNATTTQMVDPLKRTWAVELMQRLNLPAQLPAPIVEPGSIIGHALAGYCRPLLSFRNHGNRSRVSRYGLRCGCNFCSRRHRLSQFRNVVAAGHRTGFSGYHLRCVANELHQRRRREWNDETTEERHGPVDAAGLP